MLIHFSFRWVECQFESLKRCPKGEFYIANCLQSLPPSLDATYERMLCNIPEESVEAARRILTLLCFSSRPVTVPELIDGVAVNVEEPQGLDPRRRVEDVDDLREICPGLIEFNTVAKDRYAFRR